MRAAEFSLIIAEELENKWNKVFKNGPSKICGKQSLKNQKEYGLIKQAICLPQVLLGPFLRILYPK